jgi:hypothetical protein
VTGGLQHPDPNLEIRAEERWMATTVDVTGQSPLSFTDADGSQRFVPLSAFEFSGSKVQLKSDWASEFTSAEQTIMLALAGAKAAAGELTPPPVLPPVPAIVFTAAATGPSGNTIVVKVTPDAGTVLSAKVALNATGTFTYADLADAAAAKSALGVDAPIGGERKGTGVVMLKKSGAMVTGQLPKDQSLSVKAAGVDVLAADNTTKLFTLVPHPDAPSAGVPVKITADTAANTFTLEATYDAKNTSKIALAPLDPLPASVALVVSASSPPGGMAMPAGGDVQLSGGADGVAATGTAYTG